MLPFKKNELNLILRRDTCRQNKEFFPDLFRGLATLPAKALFLKSTALGIRRSSQAIITTVPSTIQRISITCLPQLMPISIAVTITTFIMITTTIASLIPSQQVLSSEE